jgi:hypothetical protein
VTLLCIDSSCGLVAHLRLVTFARFRHGTCHGHAASASEAIRMTSRTGGGNFSVAALVNPVWRSYSLEAPIKHYRRRPLFLTSSAGPSCSHRLMAVTAERYGRGRNWFIGNPNDNEPRFFGRQELSHNDGYRGLDSRRLGNDGGGKLLAISFQLLARSPSPCPLRGIDAEINCGGRQRSLVASATFNCVKPD